jgi:UDPglucose 6-dehydrogenase
MNITVIGTGYLAPSMPRAWSSSATTSSVSIPTWIDRSRLVGPFFEPGLAELLGRGLASGRLSFGGSLADAAAFGDVHFICVGTPQLAGSLAADTRYVDEVVEGLAPHLHRPALVVGKSTVPVGTAARLAKTLAAMAPVGKRRNSPESRVPARRLRGPRHDGPDRLVAGVASARADAVLRSVYAQVIDAGVPYIRTDLGTAELAKVSANAFLATKISFINAMLDLCDAAGADVVTLAEVLGHDARIGSRGPVAGLGFGGGARPRTCARWARGEELGVAESLRFLHEIDLVNTKRQDVVGLAARLAGHWPRPTWPSWRFLRRIPTMCATRLRSRSRPPCTPPPGSASTIPRRRTTRRRRLRSTTRPDVEKAAEDADIVLHLTEWRQYREIDPVALGRSCGVPC